MRSLKTLLFIIALTLGFNTLYAQKGGAASNQVGKMLSLYLDIKNALINNDGTTAKIKATELHNILIAQPDQGLDHLQVKVLMDNMEILIENSREIAYTVNENIERHYFANLTAGIYDLIKGLGYNSMTIYRQYCPVNKAYWLSETATIKNPYFNYGLNNKVCKTVETIPPTGRIQLKSPKS